MRLSFGAVAGLAAVVLIAAAFFLVDRRATQRALENVERRDNAAANDADDARGRYDACAYGLWDFGAGKCVGVAADRGN